MMTRPYRATQALRNALPVGLLVAFGFSGLGPGLQVRVFAGERTVLCEEFTDAG
jgi:hypothetical protein